MAPRIVVVGSVNMDLVATAPVLPRPGQTVMGRDFASVPGGKGGNQAIAAARAGGASALVAAIGSDSFGVTLQSRLSGSAVDTSRLRVVYGTSGVALVMVDDFGEIEIVVAPGANAQLTGLTDDELAAVRAADVLLCQLEVPVETVTAAVVAARSAGTRVLVNAAPARPLPAELLDATDLLVVNRAEARAVVDTAGGDDEELAGELLRLVPRVVLTMSSAGSWYAERGTDPVRVPTAVVEPVDRTAVGDAFCGALAVAWGEGRSLPEAVRWASAAGACCARRPGSSISLPHRAEIDELHRQTYAGAT